MVHLKASHSIGFFKLRLFFFPLYLSFVLKGQFPWLLFFWGGRCLGDFVHKKIHFSPLFLGGIPAPLFMKMVQFLFTCMLLKCVFNEG